MFSMNWVVKWSLVKMPILPCPMGARCTDGEAGAIWKSVDIAFEQAQALVADHVRFSHQNIAAGAAPAQLKAKYQSQRQPGLAWIYPPG